MTDFFLRKILPEDLPLLLDEIYLRTGMKAEPFGPGLAVFFSGELALKTFPLRDTHLIFFNRQFFSEPPANLGAPA